MKNFYEICPVCGNTLVRQKSSGIVLDGNTVYECVADEQHKFWKNAREVEYILHLNEHASETNFHSDADYMWENDMWILKNTNNIEE